MKKVRVAGQSLPVDEAFEIAVGYCLGRDPLPWTLRRSGVGEDRGNLTVGAFAYESYDCVLGSISGGIEAIDILVANGLNARMYAREIAGVAAIAEELSDCLRCIHEGTTFWDLEPGVIVEAPTGSSDPSYPIWRAWTLLMGVEGIDLARTHKTLHHRRPEVFPLLDNRTIERLDRPYWPAIHRDLRQAPATWQDLEEKVAIQLDGAGCATHPCRLRLHDILLWCFATGNVSRAKERLPKSSVGSPSDARNQCPARLQGVVEAPPGPGGSDGLRRRPRSIRGVRRAPPPCPQTKAAEPSHLVVHGV